MPLTSRQIIDLAVNQAGTRSLRGALEAARRASQSYADGAHRNGTKRTDRTAENFLDALAEQPLREQPTTFTHPTKKAKGGGRAEAAKRFGGTTGLSDSDRLWLSRLPSDPTQVSYDDAARLAGIASGLPSIGPDAQYFNSIWKPINAVYDQREAQADLANARIPFPPIPPVTRDALTDAIAREVPELNTNEARQRAEDTLHEAVERRENQRDLAITSAKEKLTELEKQARRSKAVTV